MKYLITKKFGYILMLSLCIASCKPKQYAVVSETGQYIPVTKTNHPDRKLQAFIGKYKSQMDTVMNQVIGQSDTYMTTGKPESLLTNLTTDVMMKIDKAHTDGKTVDLAFMNVFGIRAPIAEGPVTVGTIFSAFPFENSLVVVRLKGVYVKQLFDAIAKVEKSGVSGNVRLKIKNKKVESATLNGKLVDDNKIYTIVTLDYLAEGNDGMDAFKKSESVEQTGLTLRDYMLDYVKELTKENKKLTSKIDGRILIEN